MPRPARQLTTRGVVLRGVLFTLAIALGALAVWLISTTDSPRTMRLGVLAGFWGLLLGAFALVGSRRSSAAAETASADAAAAPLDATGTALEVRPGVAVERAAEAEEPRALEAQLEARLSDVLRREVRHVMGGELGALRSEIASLRSELVEKVGGQIRLERIETTRVIGSDLEALQHEVRQLKLARDGADFTADLTHRTGDTLHHVLDAPAAPPSTPTTPTPASPTPASSAPATVNGVAPARVPAADDTRPIRRAGAEPAGTPPETAERTPAPGHVDALASLPRITPFTEFELDPIEPPQPAYRGRRRRADDDEPSNTGPSNTGPSDTGPSGTGRSGTDDVLARLLARERVR